jgi:hypothetical protein
VRPRTCCAAFLRILTDSRNLSAFTETTDISGACQSILSVDLKRACSTKFERSAQTAHGVLVGNLPKRGNSLTLALQWIVRSGRTFLLYPLPA